MYNRTTGQPTAARVKQVANLNADVEGDRKRVGNGNQLTVGTSISLKSSVDLVTAYMATIVIETTAIHNIASQSFDGAKADSIRRYRK